MGLHTLAVPLTPCRELNILSTHAVKPLGDNFTWMVKVKCSSCREEHPNFMGIDATASLFAAQFSVAITDNSTRQQETHDISGSRGEANLVWRCQLCKKENNISACAPCPPSAVTS